MEKRNKAGGCRSCGCALSRGQGRRKGAHPAPWRHKALPTSGCPSWWRPPAVTPQPRHTGGQGGRRRDTWDEVRGDQKAKALRSLTEQMTSDRKQRATEPIPEATATVEANCFGSMRNLQQKSQQAQAWVCPRCCQLWALGHTKHQFHGHLPALSMGTALSQGRKYIPKLGSTVSHR